MNAGPRTGQERGRTISVSRRALATIVYTAGSLLCLTTAVAFLLDLAEGASLVSVLGLVWILVPWWVTAGIGIRLGMTPRAYARGVARLLGF